MKINEALENMKFSPNDNFIEAVEKMIQPALFKGHFGTSYTRIVSGLQYHLCGELDTRELAELTNIKSDDIILDECCFIGGPAIQLAKEYGCKVIGIDLMESAILAANRIADLTNLSSLSSFRVLDACNLDFQDSYFTVVWNQCSLVHDEEWIDELDRVLQPRGRMALTFQIATNQRNPEDPFGRWTLDDLENILKGRGYNIIDKTDITQRDIELGWMMLIKKLEDNKDLYVSVFGDEWVEKAHADFECCAEDFKMRKVANGRIVAQKNA
jgi:SAM-dependent methyltransferase